MKKARIVRALLFCVFYSQSIAVALGLCGIALSRQLSEMEWFSHSGRLFHGLRGNQPVGHLAPTAHQHSDQAVFNVRGEILRPLAHSLVRDAEGFGCGGLATTEHFNGLLFGCHTAIVNRSSPAFQL